MTRLILKYIFIFLLFGQLNSVTSQSSSTYVDLIASADSYFSKKDYYNAKTTYQLALLIETNAEYPKNKIKEIIQKLNDELELRIIYEEKIEDAEEAYFEKDYQKAIRFYQEALEAINYEEYPKQEIARIKKEWDELKNKQNAFEQLLIEAKDARQSQDFTLAIAKLEEANNLFSSKSEVLGEIAQLKLLLKQQNLNQSKFNSLVAKADKHMEQGHFQVALKNYQEAMSLSESDNHVLSQLVLVKEAIKVEDAYNKAVEKADAYYVALELEDAKKAYEEAGKIWPEKMYPINMLSKLDEAKQRRAATMERISIEYNTKIASADRQFNGQKYEQAYDLYIKALNIKPEESYPQNQIQAINRILASGSIDIDCEIFENGKALTDVFIEVIENGTSEELAVSVNGKHKLKLKLNNNYILKFKKDGYIHKLFAIDSHLPDDKNLNTVFTMSLSVELFPTCSIDLSLFDKPLANIIYQPSNGQFSYDLSQGDALIRRADQIKNECFQRIAEEQKQKKYDALLADAAAFKIAENYTDAIFAYQNASQIFPENGFAQEQILILNALALRDKEYDQLVASGDLKYSQAKLDDALFDYYKAGNLKPNAAYPQERITEIDRILAIQNVEEKDYQNRLYLADSLFDVKSWAKAIAQYEGLIVLKRDEQYPKNRLQQAKQFLAAQNKLNSSYQAAIQKADAYFDSQSFPNARAAYLEANRIKPDEQYPLYKIEDINTIVEQKDIRQINDRYRELVASADRLFAEQDYPVALSQYKQASVLKPNETYPPQQIAKIGRIIAAQNELDNQYKGFIKSADSVFYIEELRLAKSFYIKAGVLKPKEEYPVIQINKIDALLSEMNDMEFNYRIAISSADSAFSVDQYSSAKLDYKLALTFKPAEIYPKQKIEEINALLAQLSAMESQYLKAIQEGDRNFAAENYLMALTNYKEALKIKANEEYPKLRINAIELILADLDLIDKTYNEALATADKLFYEEHYQEALSPYQKANQLKPTEYYPKEQITKIRNLLGENEQKYQAFIKQGDDAYRLAIFQDAIVAYENALGIRPNEAYPRMMLDKIDSKIRRESVVSLVESTETISMGKEKRYTFKPIDYRDRQDNYILIEMKNATDKQIRVFINFGKDAIKNGGYTVNLVQRDGFTKYFVRIDRQLRWQKEDNNWISLLAEGGDLEVNRIQISREDKSN